MNSSLISALLRFYYSSFEQNVINIFIYNVSLNVFEFGANGFSLILETNDIVLYACIISSRFASGVEQESNDRWGGRGPRSRYADLSVIFTVSPINEKKETPWRYLIARKVQ